MNQTDFEDNLNLLLRRINDASPEIVDLTADELDLLTAFLGTHPPNPPYEPKQPIDLAALAAILGLGARIKAMRCHWEYVRRLNERRLGPRSAVPETDPAETSKEELRLLTLLGDDTRKLDIARSSKSTDQKMRDIYEEDSRTLGWTSRAWGDLLGVTDAAVRSTDFWKNRERLRDRDV
jgi:hypothetical protein